LANSLCIVLSWFDLDQLPRYQLSNHLDCTAGAVSGAIIHASSPRHWLASVVWLRPGEVGARFFLN